MHHFFEGLILDLGSVPWVVGGWAQRLKEGRYKEFKTSKIQYGCISGTAHASSSFHNTMFRFVHMSGSLLGFVRVSPEAWIICASARGERRPQCRLHRAFLLLLRK